MRLIVVGLMMPFIVNAQECKCCCKCHAISAKYIDGRSFTIDSAIKLPAYYKKDSITNKKSTHDKGN